MKNRGILLGITVLLLIMNLSGCQETSNQNNNHQNNTTNNSTNTSNGNQTNNTTNGTHQNNTTENTFLGDWEVVDSPDYETWSFYSNLTAKNYIAQNFEGNIITTIVWFDYTIDSTTLCLSTKDDAPESPNYYSLCYSYVFSENATRLQLFSDGISVMDLQKMPFES